MTLKFNGPTINIEDLAMEIHREKITKLLNKNIDMMAENFYELGKAKEIKHTIPKKVRLFTKDLDDKQNYYRNL